MVLIDLKRAEGTALDLVRDAVHPLVYEKFKAHLCGFFDEIAVHFVTVEHMKRCAPGRA